KGNATAVVTAEGETIPAGGVIFATGAAEHSLIASLTPSAAPLPDETQFTALKAHLLAVRPGVSRTPFCLADQGGFNHLPHADLSVFGSNRWVSATGRPEEVDPQQIERLWTTLEHLFPSFERTQ